MSARASAVPAAEVWRPSQARRRWSGWLFYGLAVASTLMGLVMLGALLYDIFTDGAGQVDWHFLTNYPSRIADNAGLRSALLGSLWMLAFTAIIAFPLGVGAAIYLASAVYIDGELVGRTTFEPITSIENGRFSELSGKSTLRMSYRRSGAPDRPGRPVGRGARP